MIYDHKQIIKYSRVILLCYCWFVTIVELVEPWKKDFLLIGILTWQKVWFWVTFSSKTGLSIVENIISQVKNVPKRALIQVIVIIEDSEAHVAHLVPTLITIHLFKDFRGSIQNAYHHTPTIRHVLLCQIHKNRRNSKRLGALNSKLNTDSSHNLVFDLR